jgi:hypothetical protein
MEISERPPFVANMTKPVNQLFVSKKLNLCTVEWIGQFKKSKKRNKFSDRGWHKDKET